MLHYAVNRPQGALLGESALTTMIPWLQRYSRMLEDRIRLHWAVRSFLWLVTVSANYALYSAPAEVCLRLDLHTIRLQLASLETLLTS
jgi:hypothetical protein